MESKDWTTHCKEWLQNMWGLDSSRQIRAEDFEGICDLLEDAAVESWLDEMDAQERAAGAF